MPLLQQHGEGLNNQFSVIQRSKADPKTLMDIINQYKPLPLEIEPHFIRRVINVNNIIEANAIRNIFHRRKTQEDKKIAVITH